MTLEKRSSPADNVKNGIYAYSLGITADAGSQRLSRAENVPPVRASQRLARNGAGSAGRRGPKLLPLLFSHVRARRAAGGYLAGTRELWHLLSFSRRTGLYGRHFPVPATG